MGPLGQVSIPGPVPGTQTSAPHFHFKFCLPPFHFLMLYVLVKLMFQKDTTLF